MAIRGRHIPALDGVRALAILAVFAYHLGASWLPGGYLGVDLFFVLSGFLITSLIAEEWISAGSIALGAFWGRRARRLLPGLLLMLVVLGIWLAVAGPGPLVDLSTVRGDAIATVLYVANWHLLLAHQSYFDQFAGPSPLQHTWSLAIEEQFYLVWPLAVLGVFTLARKAWRAGGLALAAGGAAASAAWMAWLAAHGASASRLYYGTDTRASDLLVGAVLAMLVAGRAQPGDRARRVLAVAGPLGLLALGLFWWRAATVPGTAVPGRSMFEWGLLVCALAAAVMLADVRQASPSPLGRLLGIAPLVFVGRISYELYLWHWPVICELTPARLGISGVGCQLIRISVTLALSIGSYFLVDLPIRRWAFAGWPRPAKLAAAPVGMALAALVMIVGTIEPVVVPPVSAVTIPTQPEKARVVGHTLADPIHLEVPPSPAHPLRVILFGDSVMKGDAPAITASLGSTGVVDVKDATFDGWGFTTDTAWRQNVPSQIAADHAQLVIVMWSFDNDYLLDHVAQYRSWLIQFVHIVTAVPGVAGLIFQQFPQLGPVEYAPPSNQGAGQAQRNAGVNEWNRLAHSMVAIDPGHVMFLPLGSSVERDGRYAVWLPPRDDWALPPIDWVRVRSVDGVHFCPVGAARYAAALTSDLTALYHLPPPAENWSTGPWTNGPDYEEPPGNCPDDHPS